MKNWMWFVLVIMFAFIGAYGYDHCNDGGHYYLLSMGFGLDALIICGLGFAYVVRDGD
jgi:hypothetical protein